MKNPRRTWRRELPPAKLPMLELGLKDIIGIGLVALFVGALLIRLALYPPHVQVTAPGFSPDWICSPQPKGDPICFKQTGR